MTQSINISCPKCGAEIPLTEAVSRHLREELTADFQRQREEMCEAVAAREKKLAGEQAALELRARSVDEKVAQQLEAERKKLLTGAVRQAEEQFGVQLKDLQSQLGEQREKLKVAEDAELELRKRQRELEASRATLELEVARKLDEERKKIADEARRQAVEAECLKIADRDGVIKRLQEQISELKLRAEQGSIQLQGETLEVELEKELRAAFPYDELAEVKKGQRGADLRQQIRAGSGADCGSILWEAKRARNWSTDWPEKLNEDQREAKAEVAVLVTTCPRAGVRGIGFVEGIWVCEPPFAIALAGALRYGLVCSASLRLQNTGRADKMSSLYDYLCSVEFRHHIEGMVEAFKSLNEQLGAEQRAFARQWKEREQQLNKALQHTAMLYGSIQGIAGREALPGIASLELPA